jgi:hypothetical protein
LVSAVEDTTEAYLVEKVWTCTDPTIPTQYFYDVFSRSKCFVWVDNLRLHFEPQRCSTDWLNMKKKQCVSQALFGHQMDSSNCETWSRADIQIIWHLATKRMHNITFRSIASRRQANGLGLFSEKPDVACMLTIPVCKHL